MIDNSNNVNVKMQDANGYQGINPPDNPPPQAQEI